MTRAQRTWIIVAALVVSVGALIFFFAPSVREVPAQGSVSNAIAANSAQPSVFASATRKMDAEVEPVSTPDLALPPSPAPESEPTGTPWIERMPGGQRLKFVGEGMNRQLIEWRQPGTTKEEDPTCQPPYTVREKVTNITRPWGFVIDRFNTWNAKEGKQEYLPNESELPRAFQPSLSDIVQEGRTITVTKQRCGMGAVEYLVAVRR